MKLKNIYSDTNLAHSLTDAEHNKIDKVWDFIQLFNKEFVFITDYRRYVIKHVQQLYTLDEFYELEHIANKLFWNLRLLLQPLWLEGNTSKQLDNALTLCDCQHYTDQQDLNNKIKDNKIFNTVYYRSFINKLVIIDKEQQIIYTKKMEGASHIFSKNYFNLLTMYIFKNKDMYERIMKNISMIQEASFDIPTHYYQYDYAYPNLNFCVYTFGSVDDRKERIKQMYYTDTKGKQWFKLIV